MEFWEKFVIHRFVLEPSKLIQLLSLMIEAVLLAPSTCQPNNYVLCVHTGSKSSQSSDFGVNFNVNPYKNYQVCFGKQIFLLFLMEKQVVLFLISFFNF